MKRFIEVYRSTPVLQSLYLAVLASMDKVFKGQWGNRLSECKDKGDGTLCTETDLESEAAAMPYLKETGRDIWAEEGGYLGKFKTDEVILYDPLDGTASFTDGATTSTVSAAVYDHRRKVVIVCVVGEPASGRVWCAASGAGVWRLDSRLHFSDDALKSAVLCNVSTTPLSPRSTIFLDSSPTFRKGMGYPDTPAEVWGRFHQKLFGRSRIGMLGTNCGHHVLVANGGEGAVGAITTALGGPWDVTPVMLVLEAGGCARAFSTQGGQLSEVHPFAVTDYNLLVSGNTVETVDQLSGLLTTHLRECGIVS